MSERECSCIKSHPEIRGEYPFGHNLDCPIHGEKPQPEGGDANDRQRTRDSGPVDATEPPDVSRGPEDREALPLLERLDDATMVLATAPLEMDREAGNVLAQDCEDAAAEIRRLREEVAEYDESFELYRIAIRRATNAFRLAHPDFPERMLPGTAEALNAWMDMMEARLAKAREGLETISHGLPKPGEETAKVMQDIAAATLKEIGEEP